LDCLLRFVGDLLDLLTQPLDFLFESAEPLQDLDFELFGVDERFGDEYCRGDVELGRGHAFSGDLCFRAAFGEPDGKVGCHATDFEGRLNLLFKSFGQQHLVCIAVGVGLRLGGRGGSTDL
jgi:hypothetical protein